MTEEIALLQAEIEELKNLIKGTPQRNGKTLYVWLSEWLTTYKRGIVSQSQYDCLHYALELHIKGKLPDGLLREVKPIDLQRFLNGMPDSRTKENVIAILRGAFKTAYLSREIDFNPMEAVEVKKHKRKQGQALTVEEQTAFLERIKKHPLENYFRFLLYSGCRRSEALNIQKSDFNFEKRELHIPGTKTEKSDRVIPMFDNIAVLMFPLLDGKPANYRPFAYDKDRVTRAFKRCMPSHKLHDLRHTFATNCFMYDVQTKTVQEWLGHTDIQTTANIYTHFNTTISNAEAEKINRAFALA